MSTHAQRVILGPFFHDGELLGGAKVYHYTAGTSTLKDCWIDRSKSTTASQPLIADANGMVTFFADGLYKLVVKDTADNTLYTWDNFLAVDQTENAFTEGPAIASASVTAIGPEIWAHITGSTSISILSGTIPFFWAVFDGTPTLLHSASFIMPGELNRQMFAGDVAFFLHEGNSVYRMAGYLPASSTILKIQDTRTNAYATPLYIEATTTGTPAAGIGTAIQFNAESADENPCQVGNLVVGLSDVGAGTEDSYFETWLRVAGAAVTAAWRLACTGTSKGIFTHANNADRTYTFPNVDGTVVVHGQADVGTADLKTSTGSTTVTSSANGDGATDTDGSNVAMNDYSFFPSFTYVESGTGGTSTNTWSGAGSMADPTTTVGRIKIVTSVTTSTGSVFSWATTATLRWRYVTASDNPEIWIAKHPDGRIKGVWVSDDPVPGGEPGLIMAGCESIRLTAADLESLTSLNAKASDAEAYIKERKLRMAHHAYRALQLLANDAAPSKWLMENAVLVNGKLSSKVDPPKEVEPEIPVIEIPAEPEPVEPEPEEPVKEEPPIEEKPVEEPPVEEPVKPIEADLGPIIEPAPPEERKEE